MSELIDRDDEHLRLLKLAYYVLAGITGFFSLFPLLWIFLGGIFASGVIPANKGSEGDPRVFGFIFIGIGVAILLLGLASALLAFLAARNLRDRRHRTFCMVIAGVCCLYVPWGTVVGACTFMVLSRPRVKSLFGLQPAQQENLNTQLS
jgi:hypothetical protein